MKRLSGFLLATSLAVAPGDAFAQKAYGPGVTDTEIKIGNTMPWSGPYSSASSQARAQLAYYKMVNSKGGINGRKINAISYDDTYSPPKTVEQTRKLVESDEVFAVAGSFGTATNAAVQKYLNQKKVPQLFILSGASRWNDPKNFPWTVPFFPTYVSEARNTAKFIVQNKPDAKIGILYQNDDAGKDYAKGFKDGLGDKASMVVAEKSYQVTQPTVDAEIVALKYAGADVLFMATAQKFGAQGIKKVGELGWKPQIYLTSTLRSIKRVLEPAGIENSKGVFTALATKVISDPDWQNDADVKEYLAFLKEWMPDDDPADTQIENAYMSAWLIVKVLRECGDDLTRQNLMKVVTSQKNVTVPLLRPGITLTIIPEDYAGYWQQQTVTFDGAAWKTVR
jgi:ABC-type branched-subunit amino acid transport system substrate-binding protein